MWGDEITQITQVSIQKTHSLQTSKFWCSNLCIINRWAIEISTVFFCLVILDLDLRCLFHCIHDAIKKYLFTIAIFNVCYKSVDSSDGC